VNEQDKEADILLYWNKSPLKSVDIEKNVYYNKKVIRTETS